MMRCFHLVYGYDCRYQKEKVKFNYYMKQNCCCTKSSYVRGTLTLCLQLQSAKELQTVQPCAAAAAATSVLYADLDHSGASI